MRHHFRLLPPDHREPHAQTVCTRCKTSSRRRSRAARATTRNQIELGLRKRSISLAPNWGPNFISLTHQQKNSICSHFDCHFFACFRSLVSVAFAVRLLAAKTFHWGPKYRASLLMCQLNGILFIFGVFGFERKCSRRACVRCDEMDPREFIHLASSFGDALLTTLAVKRGPNEKL